MQALCPLVPPQKHRGLVSSTFMNKAGLFFCSMLLSASALAEDAKEWTAPDARGAAVPDRNFDLLKLHLEVEVFPKTRSISGKATYTAERIGAGPLVLDQVALDFSAISIGGTPVQWRVVGDTVEILVSEEMARGESVDIVIEYKATPEKGLHFREVGGGSPDAYGEVWSQGQKQDNRFWFPTWDHPNERFDYTGQVRAPAGWKTYTNTGNEMPAYLVMLAAGTYKVVGESNNQVWVGPGVSDVAVRAALGPVPGIVEHFEERSGVKYPWNGLRQFFVQRFLYGGMENTSAIINTDSVLSSAKISETRTRLPSLMAHEIAHQWYGDLLTCRSWRDLWLNEGFATFMEGDWLASRDGPDRWADKVLGWNRSSRRERAMAGRFHQGPNAPSNHNVYSKGATVLQMLRVMLGEDVFWAGMRHYTQGHQRALVQTVDLQRSMEHVSGQELGWFFQQWVELPHVPHLKVSQKYADGRLEVRVVQTERKKRPLYTLPIDIEVGTGDGVVYRREWMGRRSLEMEFALDKPPVYVAFDPKGGILADVEHEQEPAAWEAQLGSPSPVAVRRAIAALGETKTSEGLAALLADDKRSFLTREAAAASLGEQRRSDLLQPHLQASHGGVRMAVISGLGKGKSAQVISRLETIARSDANPDIRGAALKAVARLSSSRGVALARSVIRSARGDERLAGRAAEVLGKHGSASDLSVLLSSATFRDARNSGLWAAAKLVSRQDQGASRDAVGSRMARVLERHLDDLDFRTRSLAVNVLGEVGDDQSIPHLARLQRTTTVASLAERARVSIREIRSRDPEVEAEAPSEQEARIDDLEERIEALEKELKQGRDKH